MGNKRLIELLKANSFLFPSTEDEIINFEKNIDINSESPNDWNDPSAIIKRGRVKIVDIKTSEVEENEFLNLKMAARRGIQSIPKDILEKMKNKHKDEDK